MIAPDDFVRDLQRRGCRFTLIEPDRLLLDAPRGILLDRDREDFRRLKPDLLCLVRQADQIHREAISLLDRLTARVAGPPAALRLLEGYRQAIDGYRERLDWPLWQSPQWVRERARQWGVDL